MEKIKILYRNLQSCTRSRKCFLLILMAACCYTLFMTNVFQKNVISFEKLQQPWANPLPIFTICPKTDPTSMSVDQRRRIASIVADVQREIHRLSRNQSDIKAKWSVKLAAIAAELDPRMLLSNDKSARTPDMGPAPQLPNVTRHVCPEVYWGHDYGFPFCQHGMEPENCTYVPKFSSVLTALLPAVTWKPKVANFVIKQIRKFYDIPIIAIVAKGEKIDKGTQNITVVQAGKDYDEATYMNKVIEKVDTPFVLIGVSLSHFSNQSSLERLVRIMDELEHVKVAGGSARDIQGRWKHGCLQQRMAVYQAHYAMGYYYSKHECMYCDDLLAPFVTYRKLLIDVPFSKEVSGPALYRDWFASVTVKGHLTMSCPDVMFFMSAHVTMDNSSWHLVAKKWLLEKVHSYDNEVYIFDCPSVNIKCTRPFSFIRQRLLPRCCRAIMEKYIGYMDDFSKKENMPYEIQSGTALGAVKMGGYLPWDSDGDAIFECKDYNKWITIENEFTRHGCRFHVIRRGTYVNIKCAYSFLEIICRTKNWTSSVYLPEEYQKTPTTINYAGRDIVVISNPGLFVRNKLGFDILRHAAHWRTLPGNKTGYSHSAGTWNRCKHPEFHSCLDHYPGDGNLPFLEPFLHL